MKKKLNDIADVSIGASISRYSKNYNGQKEQIAVLYCKVDEFYTKTDEIASDVDSKYFTENGDVIFKLSEPQCAISVNENSDIPEGVLVSSKFVILKPKDINPDFLAELLNSNVAKNQIQKFSEGIIKQIKKSDLGRLEFEIPEQEEQKKYVEYIRLINKEIKLQKQLIEENNDLKEGIIQKTQGVE